MATQTGLSCPKCGGRMHAYERTSILVEQCEECRGIFLDHGELERLIDAEGGGWSGQVAPPSQVGVAGERVAGSASDGRRRPAIDLRDLFGDED